ncbi:ABC transporter permease [Cupriavidus necator]
MQILKYIGRRMLLVVPQIIGIVFVSFMLVKTIPGDPAVLMLGPTATPDAIASLRESMGLDKPLPVQFGLYLKNLAKGDMGTSWQTTRPVLEDLVTRFPATLELVTAGLLVAILIGLPLGLISAFRPRSWLSKVADFYSLIAGSLPDFWCRWRCNSAQIWRRQMSAASRERAARFGTGLPRDTRITMEKELTLGAS